MSEKEKEKNSQPLYGRELVKSLMPAWNDTIWRPRPMYASDAREAIASAYIDNGWRPPSLYLYAEDISEAFEMVRLLRSDDSNWENYRLSFSAGEPVGLEKWQADASIRAYDQLISQGERYEISSWCLWSWFGKRAQERCKQLLLKKGIEFYQAAPRRRGPNWPRKVALLMRDQLAMQGHVSREPRMITESRFQGRVFEPSLRKYFCFPRTFVQSVLFYECIEKKSGVAVDGIDGARQLAKNVFLCAPFERICVIVDPPLEYNYNYLGLHRADGPAVDYGYGQKVFAIHGKEVSGELSSWLNTELPAKAIMQEAAWGVQVDLINLLGFQRMITELNPVIVDEEPGYELFRVDLREPFWFLRSVGEYGIVTISHIIFPCSTVRQALSWVPETQVQPIFKEGG